MKTQDELEAIKTTLALTHKMIYTIEIATDEEETEFRTIFLKKFDRACLAAVQKVASGGDSLKAVEVFLKNTYIGGDDVAEIINDLHMLRSIEGVVIDLITVKKASIKKN